MYTVIVETYGEELEIAFRIRNEYRDKADKMILKNDWLISLTEEQALENPAYRDGEGMLRSFIHFERETIKEVEELAASLSKKIEKDFLAISLLREGEIGYMNAPTLYSYNRDGLIDQGKDPFTSQERITETLRLGLEEDK